MPSRAARATGARWERVARHARLRAASLGIAVAAAALVSRLLPAIPEATPRGVAAALGEATRGKVDSDDFVWAPSRGAFVDAVWGRDVAFLARRPAPGGVRLPRDVFRARVTVAPGGRPLRVVAVEQATATPLADEHGLVAADDVVAWVVHGEGGEHGVTVQAPAAAAPPQSKPPLRGARVDVDVVFATPVESMDIELRAGRLLLNARDGEAEGRAMVEYLAPEARVSGALTDFVIIPPQAAAASHRFWQEDIPSLPRPAPKPIAAAIDAAVFPPPLAWTPIALSPPAVAGDVPAPAAVARAVIGQGADEVVITGLDMRQLALRVVPGPAAPAALAGLRGTGRLPRAEEGLVVATAPIAPVRAALPGALERGRVISPLAADAPRISADERGAASLVAREGFAPFGAVQTADPQPGEHVAAWCRTANGTIFVATSSAVGRAPMERALEPLGCAALAWVAGTPDAAPFVAGDSESRPFAAFLRVLRFPEGRKEEWAPSKGRQPSPAFRPAILEREETVLGQKVHVTAFVEGRFSWALRAGTRERSHRAGGTFPEAIEQPLLDRAVAAIDVGVGLRKRPNGLTIDGSTGHAYASRGAVLYATPQGLSLVPSAEVRDDPRGDAVELPLTASGGTPTPVALKRGLQQVRGDVCVLPDGTALVALAEFDSHAATVEALCRLGCSEVAALDRGLDLAPGLERPTDGSLAPTHPATRLVALDPGSSRTP